MPLLALYEPFREQKLHHNLYENFQTDSWANPLFHSMGTGDSFRTGNRPGLQADHSPPSRTKVQKLMLYFYSNFIPP